MTRYEFLAKLREALILELDERAVKEHVDYYSSYIMEAVGQGRSEAEVIEELGDPWAIARSIINMEETSANGRNVYDSYETVKNKNERKQEEKKTADAYSVHRIPWWKTLLVIIGIIGVITLVFAIVGGIISLIAPFILPVLIIITIVRLIKRDK